MRRAWRIARGNLARHATQAVVTALSLTLVLAGLAAAELSTVRRIVDEARNFRSAGGSVQIVVAEGRIDGASCDALSDVAGVRSAGALRRTGQSIAPAALPSSPVPVWETTAGFPAVVRASRTSRPGVILPERILESLGVTEGDELVATTSRFEIAGSYPWPEDGRRASLGNAALFPVADHRPFDECWAEVWPTDARVPLSSALDPGGENPTAIQLNATLGTSFDGKGRFDRRITRYAAFLASAIAFLVGFAAVEWRGARGASKRDGPGTGAAASSRRRAAAPSRHLALSIEATAWVAPACLVAAVVVESMARGQADAAALRILGFRILALGAVGMALGLVCALGCRELGRRRVRGGSPRLKRTMAEPSQPGKAETVVVWERTSGRIE